MPTVPTITSDVFVLKVPDIDTIGHFSRCSGLEMSFEMFEYGEGGNNDYMHKLPGRMHFPNLILERGLTKEDALLKWFAQTKKKAELKQIILTVKTGSNERTFTFGDAFPVRWTGPSFDANAPGIGTESLEIAHSGLVLPT